MEELQLIVPGGCFIVTCISYKLNNSFILRKTNFEHF